MRSRDKGSMNSDKEMAFLENARKSNQVIKELRNIARAPGNKRVISMGLAIIQASAYLYNWKNLVVEPVVEIVVETIAESIEITEVSL